MTDDGGVLGNLPNSRPGKRSAKRGGGAGRPAKTSAKAASRAEAEGKAAAKPARAKKRTSAKPGAGAAGAASPPKAAQRKRTTAVKKPGSGDGVVVDRDMRGQVRHDPVPPSPAEDPVGAVVRTGLGIAETGVKVAGAVTRELFRRLPRP
jgi:hypothetical protein